MSDIYSRRVQFPTCVSAAWGAALTLHDHLVHDDDNDDYDDDGDNDDVADHDVDDEDHLAHDDGDKNYEDDNETNTNCTCSGSIADPTSHRVQWSLLWYWFIWSSRSHCVMINDSDDHQHLTGLWSLSW